MMDLVTLGEAKHHCRLEISGTDSDVDMMFKISQASEIVFDYLKLTAPPAAWLKAGTSPPVYLAPHLIKAACLLIISELFENREASVVKVLTEPVKAMLDRTPSMA